MRCAAVAEVEQSTPTERLAAVAVTATAAAAAATAKDWSYLFHFALSPQLRCGSSAGQPLLSDDRTPLQSNTLLVSERSLDTCRTLLGWRGVWHVSRLLKQQ